MRPLIAPLGFLLSIIAIAVIVSAFSNDATPKTSMTTGSDLIRPYLLDEVVIPVPVKDQSGNSVNIGNEAVGKALVTFWQSTCGECATGLPVITSFASAHPEINMIYINVRDPQDKAATALQTYNLQITTLYDDGTALNAWHGTMPATYFIVDGRFKAFFPGRVSAEHLNALLTL